MRGWVLLKIAYDVCVVGVVLLKIEYDKDYDESSSGIWILM